MMRGFLDKFYTVIDKIGKRNFMLITFVIVMVLIVGLYQTFSLYTSSEGVSIVDGLKTFKFILGSDNTENSVMIASGSSKNVAITVSNADKMRLKYGIYYSSSDDLSDVNLGYLVTSEYPGVGVIGANEDYLVTIKVYNFSDEIVTINFGLVYGVESGGDLQLEEGQYLLDSIELYKEEVDCIESNGTQYIDTGFRPNQDTSIEFVAETTEAASTLAWFGARTYYQENTFTFWQLETGMLRSDYGTQILSTIEYDINTKYKVYKNKNVTSINDVVYTTATYANFDSPANLILFSVSTTAGGSDTVDQISILRASLRFYSCRIWDNGTLVRDYIPVIDWYGVPCLYDKVGQELYYNDNETGDDFSAYYKSEVEYLVSDGTQYIDTEINPNQDTSIEFVAAPTEAATTSPWFGARSGWTENTYTLWQMDTGIFRSDYATENKSTTVEYGVGTKYVIYKNKNVTSINDVVYATSTYSEFTTPGSMVLFSVRNLGDGSDDASQIRDPRSILIFYSCRIWDNDILVRDYIPVIDFEGVPCLYDKIGRKLYYNLDTNENNFGTP